MPSLRRSFSSPSVRSSPYPSSLSAASPSTARTRASGPHPRRSASGATAERRVLADIEWWRVYDGQCDLDQLQDGVQAPDSDIPPGGMVTLTSGGSPVEPPIPLSLHGFSLDSMQFAHSDTFAVLSIAPHSPSRRGRDFSAESTPELSAAPLETVQFGLAGPMTCPFDLYSPSITRMDGRQNHPSFGLRSVSAPCQGDLESPDFSDIGGDTFSINQNLFQ